MSRVTPTKLGRMFEESEYSTKAKPIFNRRAEILPAQARFQKKCMREGCEEPMFVAPGQIAYMHAECRKMARNG